MEFAITVLQVHTGKMLEQKSNFTGVYIPIPEESIINATTIKKRVSDSIFCNIQGCWDVILLNE
jgi:hypothetical protein